MLRIIIVDDHTLVRNELCRFLSGETDIVVVGAVADGEAAMTLLKNGLLVDMMLTDLNIPGMDGFELTRQAIAFQAGLKVIVLTLHPRLAFLARVLATGAKECLSKDGEPDDLLQAIRTVHAAA